MFKQPSPVRQMFMERQEAKIKAAEKKYEDHKNALIARHAEEIERMYATHDKEHEGLLSEIVESI